MAVSHALPIRYVLRPRQPLSPPRGSRLFRPQHHMCWTPTPFSSARPRPSSSGRAPPASPTCPADDAALCKRDERDRPAVRHTWGRGEACSSASSAHIRAGELVPRGGDVTCLVSGGADSTCLWHALRALGYGVSRAPRPPRPTRRRVGCRRRALCRSSRAPRSSTPRPPGHARRASATVRYRLTEGRGLRATGHTASDQVETVLYRLVSSGTTRGIRLRRGDGVVRPLLAALARGDGGATAARTTSRTGRLLERRHRSAGWSASGSSRCSRRLASRARASLLALSAERSAFHGALERVPRRPSRPRGGHPHRPISARRPRRALVRVLRLEGTVGCGPWRLEGDAARPRRPLPSARRSPRGPFGRRCRISSWTRRCRGTSAPPGRVVVAGTVRWSRSWGSEHAPGWEGAVRAARMATGRHGDVGPRGRRRGPDRRDHAARRVVELGAEISADYAGRDLLLVGVLKGGDVLHGRPDAGPHRAV